MKQITQDELDEMLAQHEDFLEDRNNGKPLNVSGYDFTGLDFGNSNLSGAIIYFCTFTSVSFTACNLRGVSFRFCCFQNAKFVNAELTGTDFSYCDADEINTRGANMSGIIIHHSSFS